MFSMSNHGQCLVWSIITKIAPILSVRNFGKICRVLPYVTQNIKSGQKCLEMANNGPVYLVMTKYNQLCQVCFSSNSDLLR
jgi:hypothetical protein